MVFSSFLEYFFFLCLGGFSSVAPGIFWSFFFFTEFTWFHGRVTVGNGGDKGVGRPVGIFFSLFFFFFVFWLCTSAARLSVVSFKKLPAKKKERKEKDRGGERNKKEKKKWKGRERERERERKIIKIRYGSAMSGRFAWRFLCEKKRNEKEDRRNWFCWISDRKMEKKMEKCSENSRKIKSKWLGRRHRKKELKKKKKQIERENQRKRKNVLSSSSFDFRENPP